MGEKAYDPEIKAEIDLMKNNMCYVVKDGQLHEKELPRFGDVVITIKTHDGKVKMIETTTTSRKLI